MTEKDTQRVRWEYMVFSALEYPKAGMLQRKLNKLGEDGWELVTSEGFLLYLKRVKAEMSKAL
jgi:hypothetical protein